MSMKIKLVASLVTHSGLQPCTDRFWKFNFFILLHARAAVGYGRFGNKGGRCLLRPEINQSEQTGLYGTAGSIEVLQQWT